MAEQGPRGGNTEDQGGAAGGRGGGNEGQGAPALTRGGGSIIQYEVKLDMDDQLTQERLCQLYWVLVPYSLRLLMFSAETVCVS